MDVPVLATRGTEDGSDVVWDGCGTRRPDWEFRDVTDQQGGCPACEPDASGSQAVDG